MVIMAENPKKCFFTITGGECGGSHQDSSAEGGSNDCINLENCTKDPAHHLAELSKKQSWSSKVSKEEWYILKAYFWANARPIVTKFGKLVELGDNIFMLKFQPNRLSQFWTSRYLPYSRKCSKKGNISKINDCQILKQNSKKFGKKRWLK